MFTFTSIINLNNFLFLIGGCIFYIIPLMFVGRSDGGVRTLSHVMVCSGISGSSVSNTPITVTSGARLHSITPQQLTGLKLVQGAVAAHLQPGNLLVSIIQFFNSSLKNYMYYIYHKL